MNHDEFSQNGDDVAALEMKWKQLNYSFAVSKWITQFYVMDSGFLLKTDPNTKQKKRL